MNPKHQYRLFQWGECVYGAQSWKEWILLRESKIILIDKWTLILKKGAKFMKPKHLLIYPSEENEIMVPNH